MVQFVGNVTNKEINLHARPDVINAFEVVSEDFLLDAQAVIDYFEDTYTGRLRPGSHRRVPLFELSLWNMYNQTLDDLPRTNNAV